MANALASQAGVVVGVVLEDGLVAGSAELLVALRAGLRTTGGRLELADGRALLPVEVLLIDQWANQRLIVGDA